MDKNAIKKYAVWAREELIKRVSKKAEQYGISDNNTIDENAIAFGDNVLSDAEIKQRKELIKQIKSKGYEQVIEEVAYTWFNRFAAIRFMEVNNYLPSRIRVFTDADNNFKPQILDEAIHLELDGLKIDKVLELKDQNKTDELYKYLLITQCNALSKILPGMFQKINDYTELLFPDNILREGSVVEQMITLIPEEDWQDAVQIIGWLYQYYNIKLKSNVDIDVNNGKKVSKELIPAATQLFTPDWIVRYMVENSLGRLWVEGHPNEELKTKWEYYLEESDQEEAVKVQLETIRKKYANMKPEEIKCIDPCMGSGHILVYMFDVLMQIYESYGYSSREAVENIVANNIYGLDIDERAAQLSYFAIMMKARQYDKRFFSRDIQPNVYAICESNDIDKNSIEYFIGNDKDLKIAMETIITEMHDATEYGSILNITNVDFEKIFNRFEELEEDVSIFKEIAQMQLLPLAKVAFAMAQKYDVVVTNPPYMGKKKKMNDKISNFVEENYPNSKMDLFSIFIEKTISMTKFEGYTALMTPSVWLYLYSYIKLRQKLCTSFNINSYIELEKTSFDDATVSICSFIFDKNSIDFNGTYISLSNFVGSELQPLKALDALKKINLEYTFYNKISSFENTPDNRFIYNMSNQTAKIFFKSENMDKIANPKAGMQTSKNDVFLKLWYEVTINKIGFNVNSTEEALKTNKKWFPYNKGGGFRKWYGNNEYVVNYENDGKEVKDYAAYLYKSFSRTIKNTKYFFKKSITWSDICGATFAARACDKGFIFDVKGSSAFTSDYHYFNVIALLNSTVSIKLLNMLNPSVTTQVGDLKQLPIIKFDDKLLNKINNLSELNISISKTDWDSFETSWDFTTHPFIKAYKTNKPMAEQGFLVGRTPNLIQDCYIQWATDCNLRFNTLKSNEEELNRIFIDIYGLQDELTPDVEDKDVTVRLADKTRDIKSFISYAVGCMFGRYSLDVEGLAYAGGEFDSSKYTTFSADTDNIIPICDDEYFDDDIVGRFIKFVETVYGKETLDENLKFISDALGTKGTPKEVIRNYFINGFYADHCKIYQKRPIYWLFDSGKKNGFKALIYMHRYKEDTIARIRTDYVHEQQSRYRTAIADLEHRILGASTSDKVKLTKELTKLKDQELEIRTYEEKVHHLADQMIRIDLDDGVKHNYEIFKDVLAKIK